MQINKLALLFVFLYEMGEKFWNLLRTYSLQSSLIGLKYFYLYPDIISRCFWAINLITVVSCSCMISWLLYSRFDEMPTRISIENQFESIFNLPYPTITLCSPTQMTTSSLKYFNESLVNGRININLQATLPQLLGFYELVGQLKQDELKQLQQVFELNRYTVPEVMGKLPLSCEKFLKRCIFENKIYSCKDLFQPIITSHGYCCAFNSKYYFNGKKITLNPLFKNFTINTVGSSLIVVSDFEPHNVFDNTMTNAGSIRVMVTDITEFPVDYETFLVDPEAEAFMILRATYTYCSEEVHLLPSWSRECNFDYEKKLHFFNHYRNSDCNHLCYVEAVQQVCHCVLFFVPNIRAHNICNLVNIPCVMNVKQNLSTWITEQCDCPRDCVSRKYRADLSLGNFNAIPYMIDSQNPYVGLTFNDSSSILNFFFLSPVYVKQKQETVLSIISVASNLGGVFGLFMGFSGISLLEIFFYAYRGLRNYTRSWITKRRQRGSAVLYLR